MLAFVGAIVQEAYTFPFYPDAPTLFTAGHDWGTHNGSMLQILLACSFFEIMTLPAVIDMVKGVNDRMPGEFSLDLFGMASKDSSMAQREVKNGRYVALDIESSLSAPRLRA